MPTQWRTIAPIVGRTAAQCLEHYERLLAEDPLLFDGATPIGRVRAHLSATRVIVTELTERAAQLEKWQAALRLPVTPCEEAKLFASSMRIVTELWECVDDGQVTWLHLACRGFWP